MTPGGWVVAAFTAYGAWSVCVAAARRVGQWGAAAETAEPRQHPAIDEGQADGPELQEPGTSDWLLDRCEDIWGRTPDYGWEEEK